MAQSDQPYQTLKIILFIALGCVFTLVVLNFPKSNVEEQNPEDSVLPPGSKILKASDEMLGHQHKVGGLGESKPKDDTVVEVVEKIKPLFEEKVGKKCEKLEVLSYKTQTVAGINYFVKAKADYTDGTNQIVHLRIYKDLSKNLELTAHQLDKDEKEEIVHFQ